MKKNILAVSCSCLIILIIVIASIFIISNNDYNEVELAKISLSVYDKDNVEIFNEEINTEKEYLIDVLNSISQLEVKTVDSQYGAYITSIMGIEQNSEYYWSYYINDNYALEGVSSCKIKDSDNYAFKLEKINY